MKILYPKLNMKTKFLLIFSLFFLALLQAQTSEHLTFKGVPIDGKLTEFVAKMKLAGFTHLQTTDGVAFLSGDFAGYKKCMVGVSILKQNDLVHKAIVVFPDLSTWGALENNYLNLKSLLTEKYGEPTTVLEQFETNVQYLDDNLRLTYLQLDQCKYYSVWDTNKGTIQLGIDHNGIESCFVKLAYFDKINSAIIETNAKDDL